MFCHQADNIRKGLKYGDHLKEAGYAARKLVLAWVKMTNP